MRRASAELAEKRRASLRGYDGTLDPYHAAILFRDSRGVSKNTIFLFESCALSFIIAMVEDCLEVSIYYDYKSFLYK